MAIPHPSSFAALTPDKPALVMDGLVITFAALAARSAQAARLFSSLDVVEGDTIAILLENQIGFAELVWAAKDSGLRYVAVSTHSNAIDAAYIIGDCGATLLVTSHAMRSVACAAVAELQRPIALLMLDGAVPPFKDYDALRRLQPTEPLNGRRRGASMLYSSGTTGRPKGVRTLLADVPPTVPPPRFDAIVPLYDLDDTSVFINPGPFYHAGPLRFMMTVHRCGGSVIGFAKFDAERVLDAIGRHGGTHGFFVPAMFSRMLRLDPAVRAAADLSSMRHAIHAAAPCPPEVKHAMIAWWGPVIDELYSGTESVGHTFISATEWLAHPGSVGRPAQGCTIKVVDPSGAELPAGTQGLIMMSNGFPVEYHGQAATTSLYAADGYASLGDIGYLDTDGYLYLTDRQSHMIIVGGVNIYPQEAEQVLAQHPQIDDVAVIGVPHTEMGEEVKAVVQPVQMPVDSAALEASIIAFCRERLSLIKCPRSVDFVTELPRNEMGKLLKRVVRARYWDELGRQL